MFDYALEFELVDRNFARIFTISKDIIEDIGETKRSHIPFTEKEIKLLWDNVNKIKYVDVLLIQAYSGWRPQELGLIKHAISDLTEKNYTHRTIEELRNEINKI
ncbi:hypothetical protein [Ohessyouella blattaphilus]|uniref:hypothetical protein n=1 Tax=Ohessyouella blattaphilus TaxID=2949333 RepID=UPI003EC047F6